MSCDPNNYIGNYFPESTTTIESIDTVSLECDKLTTESLLINGSDVTSYLTTYLDKTQNESAIPNSTSFTGKINSTSFDKSGTIITTPLLYTDTISGSTTINGNYTISNQLIGKNVINFLNTSNTFGLTVASIFQPSLSAGQNRASKLLIGREDSTNNCGEISFNYVSSGSSSNSFTLNIKGSSTNLTTDATTTTCSTRVIVGTNNLQVNVRSNSTLYTFANNQTSDPFVFPGSPANISRIELTFCNFLRQGTSTTNLGPVKVQAGWSSSLWYTSQGGYKGVTFTSENAGESNSSLVWGNDGISLLAEGSWPHGGAGQTRYFNGKMIWTLMGTVGNVQYWTIHGFLYSTEVILTFGPYSSLFVGHFQTVSSGSFPVVALRVTCTTTGNTVQSGYVSIMYQ